MEQTRMTTRIWKMRNLLCVFVCVCVCVCECVDEKVRRGFWECVWEEEGG